MLTDKNHLTQFVDCLCGSKDKYAILNINFGGNIENQPSIAYLFCSRKCVEDKWDEVVSILPPKKGLVMWCIGWYNAVYLSNLNKPTFPPHFDRKIELCEEYFNAHPRFLTYKQAHQDRDEWVNAKLKEEGLI